MGLTLGKMVLFAHWHAACGPRHSNSLPFFFIFFWGGGQNREKPYFCAKFGTSAKSFVLTYGAQFWVRFSPAQVTSKGFVMPIQDKIKNLKFHYTLYLTKSFHEQKGSVMYVHWPTNHLNIEQM